MALLITFPMWKNSYFIDLYLIQLLSFKAYRCNVDGAQTSVNIGTKEECEGKGFCFDENNCFKHYENSKFFCKILFRLIVLAMK